MTSFNVLTSFTNSYRDRWTALKTISKTITEDYAIAFQRDPAARNWFEVSDRITTE